MSRQLFITGTDTEIGKTYVTAGLLKAFTAQGLQTIGLKPLASGCNNNMESEDALLLKSASSVQLAYDEINPFAFKPAVAPHIAASFVGVSLNMEILLNKIHKGLNYPADICLVEGVGGWETPLNEKETMGHFVQAAKLKTLLVVGLRLGCINHAILTLKAIQNLNVNVIGWVGNCIDPHMELPEESINTLKNWLKIPCMGIVPHASSVNGKPPEINKRFSQLAINIINANSG